jgi:hypothetical protein
MLILCDLQVLAYLTAMVTKISLTHVAFPRVVAPGQRGTYDGEVTGPWRHPADGAASTPA